MITSRSQEGRRRVRGLRTLAIEEVEITDLSPWSLWISLDGGSLGAVIVVIVGTGGCVFDLDFGV